MRESPKLIAALRGRIVAMAGPDSAAMNRIATGHVAIDAALGGGLASGRLHEVFATDPAEAASAAGFAAMLALRATHRSAAEGLLWLRCDEAERRTGGLYAPGFAELGGDPDVLLLALAPDPVALLRGAADAARCAGLGAILVECWGNPRVLDLTATRRLTLAAEQSGVAVLLLRIDAEPAPSAADTRWQVRAAPSAALEANAPGQAAFDVELLRQRAGLGGLAWRVEWDRERCAFREPALSGAMVSLPQRGPAAGDLRPVRNIA
ncbi:hypothetical protein ACFB49_19670 [Sphingomonas sp. DBB INV C78]|uniref:ImuA family protein n=1 Tax=Sphingomonas sp. DBB INV C78 TaxID=3349434 RepID=UPI0036D232B9